MRPVYDFVTSDIRGSSFLYFEYIPGILGNLYKEGYKINQDTIDDMKDALIDYFCDGVEPDWETDEAANWWDKMSPKYFEIIEYKTYGSNYYNKSLKLKKEFRPKKDRLV